MAKMNKYWGLVAVGALTAAAAGAAAAYFMRRPCCSSADDDFEPACEPDTEEKEASEAFEEWDASVPDTEDMEKAVEEASELEEEFEQEIREANEALDAEEAAEEAAEESAEEGSVPAEESETVSSEADGFEAEIPVE